MSTDELLAEALRLTRVDRARVAEELLSSLEESDEDVATAWATELERRSRESAEGRSAALWYDEQRPGLGDEFIAEVAVALKRVGDAPESHPVWPGTGVGDA